MRDLIENDPLKMEDKIKHQWTQNILQKKKRKSYLTTTSGQDLIVKSADGGGGDSCNEWDSIQEIKSGFTFCDTVYKAMSSDPTKIFQYKLKKLLEERELLWKLLPLVP